MADIIYERPEGRRQYLCISKHFANANNTYSKWISVNIEKDTFDFADYGNHSKLENNIGWFDDKGNLWGFRPTFEDVGTDRQQFGFFPKPSNENDSWHGYPIFPYTHKKYNICEELIKRWISEGYMDEDDVVSLVKKKRI